MIFYKYGVYTYDLLGNPKDGFEVNDRYGPGDEDVVLPKNATKSEIVKALKKIGVIGKNNQVSSYDIEGEEDHTLYITKNTEEVGGMFPICELQCLGAFTHYPTLYDVVKGK